VNQPPHPAKERAEAEVMPPPDTGSHSDGCLVCGASDLFPCWKGLLKCRTCGFVFADLKISDEELAGIYGDDYFHGGEYFDYGAEEESLRGNFLDRLRHMGRIAPDLATRDLLEIGFSMRRVARSSPSRASTYRKMLSATHANGSGSMPCTAIISPSTSDGSSGPSPCGTRSST
jgi:hypothetical protein